MSTPTPKGSKTPVTPKTPKDDVHQGNEELAAILTSLKGIAFVVIFSVVITLSSILIFNYFGQTATSIWALFVCILLFAIRHFIGNAETKINVKND